MHLTTSDGTTFKIDDVFYNLVKNKIWRTANSGHIYTSEKGKTLFIHTLITQCKSSNYIVCDHIDTDPTNNTVENLRITSKSINALNKGKSNFKRGVSSKYKGVCCSSKRKVRDKYRRPVSWRSYITYNKKRFDLGIYRTEEEAAMAYNLFVIKEAKDKIVLNEIDGVNYDFFIPIPRKDAGFYDNIYITKHHNKYELRIPCTSTYIKGDKSYLLQIRLCFYFLLLNTGKAYRL